MISPNALSPDLMTPAERLDEVASILAAGILRLHARENSAKDSGEGQVCLDLTGTGSGHVAGSSKRRKRHG